VSGIERASRGLADLPRIVDLLLVCASAGYVDMELRSIELRTMLSHPRFDPRRTLLIEDGTGDLLAFAVLWQGQYLGMLVHPRARGVLEERVVGWAAARVLELAGSAPAPALWALCRSDDDLLRAVYQRGGFEMADTELRLERLLDQPISKPVIPAGFEIRPLDPDRELDEWCALYAGALGDRPAPLEKWRAYRQDADYDHDLDLVAVGPDGSLAAMCTCTIAQAEAHHLQVREGRTEPIAVRAADRGIGLGRAIVLAGLHALRERGMDVARLTTEPDSQVAHHLYASLGYRHIYDAHWYAREVTR
jgi:ribosomal protein S18 acetylase RimI-like enzyme